MGPITSELLFEIFYYLINIKDRIFFYKKPSDDNPNCFWIATVQDWHRISPANFDCPLGIFYFNSLI